eukprot:2914010-Prymnesium_polylepis.2
MVIIKPGVRDVRVDLTELRRGSAFAQRHRELLIPSLALAAFVELCECIPAASLEQAGRTPSSTECV